MKKIIILTDYKGFFSSKQKAEYYRGGLDLDLVSTHFQNNGFSFEILSFNQFNRVREKLVSEKSLVLYQSSEDQNGFYKSFIEDIVYDLEKRGVNVLPKYEYLKAHNNKVSMELLRSRSGIKEIQTIKSDVFGVHEELLQVADQLEYPVVIKSASGAMSKGVALATDKKELLVKARKIAASKSFFHDLKELLRKIKYKGNYITESFYRNKFITQNLISGLDNDWKVLVYGDTCFALYRGVRDNDFRASGSGKFVFKTDLPEGMLDYAWQIRKKFDVPHISLDIAFDGVRFHLIEFQFIMFGTTTLEKSPHYYRLEGTEWKLIKGKSELEQIFVDSIVDYLSEKK